MPSSNALSLHIGLNRIDPAHYGTDGALKGCENDAAAMRRIAEATGFTPRTLLNEAATSSAVLSAIHDAAKTLTSGGIFLLTYAGHGSQIDDLDGDEKGALGGQGDGLDETWCLFDRMVADDELNRCWAAFAPGVRIAFYSDSCHSGTLARAMYRRINASAARSRSSVVELPRALDPVFASRAVKDHFEVYRHLAGRGPKQRIEATVVLVSGCQDNQTSSDGSGGNGRFTGTLLQVWNGGAFSGGHREFRDAIARRMPSVQQPNYMTEGATNRAFEVQKPFTTKTPDRGEQTKMSTNGTSDTRVEDAIRARALAATNGRGAEFEGKCEIGIRFDRQHVEGLSNEQLLRFFQDDVAPKMMENWLLLNDVVTPVRGGEISCTASTGGGGSVSCSGTIRF
jgi:metacaspase-1